MVTEGLEIFQVLFVIASVLTLFLIVDIVVYRRRIYQIVRNSMIFRDKDVNLTVGISLSFSFLRLLLLDGPIVVIDNYEVYAAFFKDVWKEESIYHSSYYIDLISRHQLRVIYSFLMMLLSFIFQDVIISGILITIVSSITLLISSEELGKLLGLREEKIKILLLLEISNVTIVTNFVRIETDVIFTVFLLITFIWLLMLLQQPIQNPTKQSTVIIVHLALFSILALFTREIGALMIANVILWLCYWLLSFKQRIRSTHFLLFALLTVMVGTIVGFILARFIPFINDIMFQLLWAASTDDIAARLIAGDYALIFLNFQSKFTLKTLEAVFYTFSGLFFCYILGKIHLENNENEQNDDETTPEVGYLETNEFRSVDPLISFLLIFFVIYLFLKLGRTLDRFFIPIIPIASILFVKYWLRDLKDLSRMYKITYSVVIINYAIFLVRFILGFLNYSI